MMLTVMCGCNQAQRCFELHRPHFPASPAYLLPADYKGQIVRNCSECTNWHLFRYAATQDNHINLGEYTSSVTSYISKCVADVVITKTRKSFSNQKAWIPGGFKYLGIHIIPHLDNLFKENYTPLTDKIKLDMCKWSSLP